MQNSMAASLSFFGSDYYGLVAVRMAEFEGFVELMAVVVIDPVVVDDVA